MPPGRAFAIVTCMDARIDPAQGVRARGGRRARDPQRRRHRLATTRCRSLVISHHLLGTQEALVIGHSDCGMLTFTNETLHDKLGPDVARDRLPPVPRRRGARPRERPPDRGDAAAAGVVHGDGGYVLRRRRPAALIGGVETGRARAPTPLRRLREPRVDAELDVALQRLRDRGSSSFAVSAACAEAVLVEPGTRPSTSSADFVIPVPGRT